MHSILVCIREVMLNSKIIFTDYKITFYRPFGDKVTAKTIKRLNKHSFYKYPLGRQ